MGMAASQARYLALVARKSNCEYQGQQINQARTALSNQSANLFNQMLGLTVPIPPSVQDFTKAQYSFTDGTNTVTMDDWKQLATPEEDFNYVVTYHYESDIYTGSQKKMNDPQVQLNTKGNATSADELKLMAKVLTDAKLNYDNAIENQEKEKAKLDEIKSKHTAAMLQLQTDKANLVAMQTKLGELNESKKDVKTYQNTSLYSKTKSCIQEGNNYKITKANGVEAVFVPYNDCAAEIKTALDEQHKTLTDNGVTIAKTDLYYNKEDGTIAIKADLENNLDTKGAARVADLPVMSTSGLNTIGTISQSINTQIASLNEQIPEIQKKITDVDQPLVDTNEELYLAEMGAYSLVENEATLAQNNYEAAQAEYEQLQYPDFVGNCQLNRIDRLTENQSTEVRQVVSDMKAQGVDNASIGRCFDENGNYLGGIYSFTLNGTTYYTTIDDLYGSYESGLDFGNNQVDTQQKLSYYNAGYVKTKIEETKKALLETDSVGRFSSIRIEDDSITFALNMETITDDVAYQDAMNHYYYENAEYDKMVQDINAKTSIIQREDQQLELKLKQLDTEQNALSNEIDAVSKVVKDNVEKSFKTFGG